MTFRKIWPLAIVFLLLLVCMPRSSKPAFEYRKGQPWKYDSFIAPFDFPILKTQEQIQEELSRSSAPAIPYYRFSAEVENKNLRAASSVDLGDAENLRISLVSSLNGIYEKGVVGDDGIVTTGGETPEVVYLQRGKRASTRPSSEVYRLSDARLALLASVAGDNPSVNVDSIFRARGIYDLLTPNLEYDSQTSQLMQAESRSVVSPTQGFVSAGQLIVSEGEIVTPEIAQMLDSYCKEYENNLGYTNRAAILYWLGNGILALALVLLIFLAVQFAAPEVFSERGRYLYLLTVLTLFMLAAILVPRGTPGLIYMVPFTLCALLLKPFFSDRLIYMVYGVVLLPLLIYSESPVVVYSIFLLAGIVAIYTFRFFGQGWKQFLNALITYAVMMILYLGFRLIDVTGGGMIRISVYLLAAAALPVAGYPLTFLFERIFNLVSNYRLSELADTSNPLLLELEKKAPGTFQHSLQVMNMADAVAREIGADIQLVRVGALYHDIGKAANPLCFVENESTITGDATPGYHAELTPLQSAQEIVKHVTDGAEMAEKHHLPRVITDFILTHHGTSRTGYFYTKFLNDGGDPAEGEAFRYPGPRPRTREQVILMLCDSIEAASRSLKDYSPAAFDAFVEKIVAGKMSEGQLLEAEISVKDLEKVKEALKSYLSQMYHERIEYPKRKNKK